ncbi:MAG: hypothetical protein ACRCTP_13580, partial [Aeromonas popoffii]|uniref:hypothetical protein n=1 Tax=Aeromonas popoffii TaxID=70856 RepID=UPI003F35B03A
HRWGQTKKERKFIRSRCCFKLNHLTPVQPEGLFSQIADKFSQTYTDVIRQEMCVSDSIGPV